jgi:snapalysin
MEAMMKHPLIRTRHALALAAAALLTTALAAPAQAAPAPSVTAGVTVSTAAKAEGGTALTQRATRTKAKGKAPLVETKVVGGTPASQAYPFLTYVGGCTGSLIKANWVVTARHCPSPSTVRVGSTDSGSGGTVASVSRTVNHPAFDVKLLQLSTSVSQTPVVIAAASGPVGTATRIIGWGLTCPTRGCAANPTTAHELDTSIVADSGCTAGVNATYEICTGNPGNKGACYGDSGGPQVKKVNGVWQLIGATSRAGDGGATCAVTPSIYTDLPALRSWITQQVGTLPS